MTSSFPHRPISHSFLNSWAYNKDDWYSSYILGKRTPPNQAMLYGNVVGDSIGTDHSLVPMLTPPVIKEYEFKAKFGKKHTLWGFADFYCPDTRVLHENKTSTNPNQWTQKKVDDHTQLTMYALMLFLKHKIKPEDVKMVLNFIPVLPTYTMPDPVVVHSFETSRTTKDVLEYSAFILDTLVEMERYVNGMRELR